MAAHGYGECDLCVNWMELGVGAPPECREEIISDYESDWEKVKERWWGTSSKKVVEDKHMWLGFVALKSESSSRSGGGPNGLL